MPEASFQAAGFGCAGFVTFGMALSALVVACLSYVQVQNNTVMMSSLAKGESPEGLHGTWQVCGEVDAISKTLQYLLFLAVRLILHRSTHS